MQESILIYTSFANCLKKYQLSYMGIVQIYVGEWNPQKGIFCTRIQGVPVHAMQFDCRSHICLPRRWIQLFFLASRKNRELGEKIATFGSMLSHDEKMADKKILKTFLLFLKDQKLFRKLRAIASNRFSYKIAFREKIAQLTIFSPSSRFFLVKEK